MPGFRKCGASTARRRQTGPGDIHDESFGLCSRYCRGRFGSIGPTCFRASRRQQARQGAFRNVVQAGSAEALRPRHAVSALVLVPRVAKGFRGCAEGRSRMRHRLLGHRAEPAAGIPTSPPPAKNLAEGAAAIAKGKSVGAKTAARARLHRCACGHVRRLRQGRSPHAHRRPMPRPWNNWRSAIRTTTRRRSTTRWRSTRRLRRPTRPTPTSSKARRSWSRSSRASRSIPASRTT